MQTSSAEMSGSSVARRWVTTPSNASGILGDRRGVAAALLAACLATVAVAVLLLPGQMGTVGDVSGGGLDSGREVQIPVVALAAVSSAVGSGERAYWLRRGPGGMRAAGPGFSARFGRDGVTFRAHGHAETLSLDRLVRGTGTSSIGPTGPAATRNRVVYSRDGTQERYANGPAGVEQSFRLAKRPLAGSVGALALELGAGGDLHPVLDRDAQGLTFRVRGGGEAVLRYSGLSVLDATGRQVPAHLAVRGDRPRIVVDDAHARYPLTIDPFVQSATLTASDGISGQYVGETVAVSADGSTVVVAGPNKGPGGTYYVFEKPAAGWADATEGGTVKIQVAGNTTDIAHAVDVSANGDTIVGGNEVGPTVVYTRPAGGWTGQYLSTPAAKLTASDGGGFFGDAVGISGAAILVSARNAKVGSNFSQGALYVYVKPAGGWQDATETARLTAADGATNDHLGYAAAIDGDTIVASAPNHGLQGSVYVFVKPPGGWVSGTQTAQLTTSGGANDYLADTERSLAVAGDTVVVGARQADVGPSSASGLVYVFVKPAGGWQDTAIETAQLTQSDPASNDYLGLSVAFDGLTIAAGAKKVSAAAQQGAAYVYVKPAGGWANATETQKLTALDTANGDQFGSDVAVGHKTIVVGAQFASAVTLHDNVGKAYVFSGPPDPVTPVTPPVTPPATAEPTPAPGTPPAAPQLASGALACTSAKVVLINVLQRAGKVRLTGAARAALAGQSVSIRFLATGKTVASGTVGTGGLFSFTVPLPPARIRRTNKARYQAVLGSNVSLPLKLTRRADLLQAKLSGGRVLLSGRVAGSFRARTPVTFSLRTTCGAAFKTVAKTRLSKKGTFRASVLAPTGAAGQIAVYRAGTTVLLNGRPQKTYTLPLPPTP